MVWYIKEIVIYARRISKKTVAKSILLAIIIFAHARKVDDLKNVVRL